MGVHTAGRGHHDPMDAKTHSDTRRRPAADRAPHDGQSPDREDEHAGTGVDLPVVGHIPYGSVGFVGFLIGLGVAGAVGVLDWPVVAAVGIGYALARRR
jgi:hypothetical protein